jgi:hypothetical protein
MKKAIQICLSTAAFLLFSHPATAQEIAWDATFSSGNTTIRHGMASIPNSALKFDRKSQKFNISSQERDVASVLRVFKLADGRSIIYKFLVKRLENGARYEALLQAHEPTPEQVEQWDIDPARVEKDFLTKYTQPITLNNGDTIALDVLLDPHTGAKLVDFFQILTDESNMRRFQISTGQSDTRDFQVSAAEPIKPPNPDQLKAEARSLTVDDLTLTVTDFEVWLNGEKIKGSGGGVGGRYIWLGIPKAGRAIFTLATPPAGSGLEQTAIVNKNRLIFWINGAQYEWISKSRIVPADGSFHVWMKFDPTLTEQINDGTRWNFGASDTLPGEKKEE